MPLDSIVVSGLLNELSPKLAGGKIDKVQQPERDMLLLTIRTLEGNLRLLIAAGGGNARVHLTEESFENPAEPPMFCMLLRKHLVGSRIASLEQPQGERMMIFELDTHDELGFESRKKLVVEMIGSSSNVVLVGADGRIIDCMRRMDFGGDALRRMLPGMIYRFPPAQSKLLFQTSSPEDRHELIRNADKSLPPDKFLLRSFAGLSPLTCREIAHRAGGYELLPEALDAMFEAISATELEPVMVLEGDKPLDFSFMPLTQYGSSVNTERYESFSKLLDVFYARRDRAERQRRRSRDLKRSVKTVHDRLVRKLASQYEELRRTDTREEVRKTAELITANIYRIRRGDRSLQCEDFYEPDCPRITIPLDPLKSPQQNAASLYKEYNKLKGAKEHLTVLIADNEKQLEYLNSVLEELDRVETERDVSDIRRELTATGYIKPRKGSKPDRSKPQSPLRFVSDDGLEILVGRSNVQNDELTTKMARRTDYWLHTQKVHGSHVLIRCDGLEPPEETLLQAASIAVYYSQGREAGKIPVDYTMVRFVRKPSGALPGKVIYTDYRTIMAESDEKLIQRLKK